MRRLLAVLLAAAFSAAPARSAETPYHLTLGGPAPRVTTEKELRAFLDELEAQQLLTYEALSLEEYYQWKGYEPTFTTPFTRFANDLSNRPDYAAVVEKWRGHVRDTTLARRLELHHLAFLQSRADPKLVIALGDAQSQLQDTVSAFRFLVNGQPKTQTEVTEILTNEKDRAKRQSAYLALQQADTKYRPAVTSAMHLYDKIGRAEGFKNGAEAGLAQTSLERAQVLKDLEDFERATRPIMQSIVDRAKADLKLDKVEPWDLDYWLRQQELAGGDDAWPREPGLERMKSLMKDIGFRPDSLPIDARIWDVPTGGITFPVRPPYESRLLSNPFTGSQFYSTLFHEYGHCLNAVLTDKDLPAVFLTGDQTPMSEGLAECLGFFAYDHHWLERAAKVQGARSMGLERAGKMGQFVWLRRSICLNAWFELTAYGNLHVNMDSLYAVAYQRFTRIDLPAGHFWGYRDMLATGPIYYQSYLYADLIAAQLQQAMQAQFGVDDLTQEPRVAGWLTRFFFAPGGSVPWPEKVRRATGKPLGTEALAHYFADIMPKQP
ncbi:MAG TPA: M3 family metallopeptidase [Burkholderiales bacterium]|nr:M3 family metallopeptidase [Burkholderiales bacterium]